MATLLSPNAKQQFFTNAGAPASGYLLYTYAAGTVTPQATYADRAGAVPNANPIVLDARGEAVVYLTPGVVYDYVLKTPGGDTVWTREDVLAGAGNAAEVAFTQSGSGAVLRTVDDKLQELISVEDFGALGDGATNDSAAFGYASAEAVARGKILTLDGSKTYAITGALSLPANLRMQTNGATFLDTAGTLSNTPFITVGDSNWIDELRVQIPTGVRRDRAVLMTGASPQVERVIISSVDQQANTGDNDDAGLRVSIGSGARLRHVEVSNFDRAVLIKDSADVRIFSLEINSYVTGFWATDSQRLKVDNAVIRTASPNASYTAGHVGVLCSANTTDGQRNIVLQDFIIEDAGEHGIRIGGPSQQSNIHIVRPRIKNCGGSGIKILGTDSGTPTDFNRRIFIVDPIIEDCTAGGVTSNMCGILVMFAVEVNITNPIIRKESKLISSHTGIRVVASQDVNIVNPFVRDAQNDGIYLDGSLGNLTRCNVSGGWSQANGRDGYRQASFTSTLTDCHVDGLYSYSNAGLGFTLAGTGGLINGRPSVRIITGSNTGGAGACDLNSWTLKGEGGMGATPLAGFFARNGSTWNDHTNNYIRKAAAWVAL